MMLRIFILLLVSLNAFADGNITNADIYSAAAIAFTKMAASTAHNACTFNGSGFIATGVAPGSANNIFLSNGTDWTSAAGGNLTDAGTDGIVITGGNGSVIGSGTSLAQHVADSTHNGYLSSTDWSTFNGKQAAGNYITALTGDVTASGPGSVAATVAKIQGTTVSGTTGTTNVVFSTSPTMTNPTVGTQASSDNSTLAASTAYVQTALAQLNPAAAVYAASTANIPGTYTNAVGGVCIGDTFTVTATGALSLDGTSPTIGVRVLLKNQTSSFQDGVWTVTVVGSVGVSPVLTRALDFDSSPDINAGSIVPVINGTVNAGSSWYQTATVTTCSSDSQTWTQFTKPSSAYVSSTLTNTHILVGNSSAVATDVAASGDVSLANTGAFTVSKVNGVSYGASPGTNTIPVVTGSNTITYETAPVAAGGTGQTSYTDGQLLIGNTSGNTLTKAALTQGTGITITNGNGSITIAASGNAANFGAGYLSVDFENASATNNWTNANTGAASDFTEHGTMTLSTITTASGFTSITKVTNLPGINFTPPNTGKVKACAVFEINNSTTIKSTFYLTDLSNNPIAYTSRLGGTLADSGATLCGILSVTATTATGVKLRGVVDTGTITMGGTTNLPAVLLFQVEYIQ